MTFRDEAMLAERVAALEAERGILVSRLARAQRAAEALDREERALDVRDAARKARTRGARVLGWIAGLGAASVASGGACILCAPWLRPTLDVEFDGRVVRSQRPDVAVGAHCNGTIRTENGDRCVARIECAGALVYHGVGACEHDGRELPVKFVDTRFPGVVMSEADGIAGIRSHGGEVEFDLTSMRKR